jgi:hypothetical protein
MDERQAQIRERAGLEESRLNQEFIEWLRKWGSPILMVVAVLAVAYALRDRWHKAADSKLDQGFEELAAATSGGNSSPDALLALANTYDGHAAISALARLEAADAYLDALRRGVKPGAVLKVENNRQTGELENPDDALTDADRTDFLKRSAELYQQVFDQTSAKAGQHVLTINALYGLAAVAEGRQELDKAKGYYEQIAKIAEANAMPAHAALANERIKKLPELQNVPKLYAKAELPPAPKKEEPAAPTITPVSGPPAPVPAPPAVLPDVLSNQPPAAPAPSPAPAPAPTDPGATPPANPAPIPAPAPAPANPTPDPATPPATPPK